MKHYVVFKGMHPTTKEEVTNLLLLKPWSEVEMYVKGVKGAKYKGFKTEKAALEAIEKEQAGRVTPKTSGLLCYVDGSFNEKIQNYGFGLACFKDDVLVHTDFGLGRNKEAISMRQIGGELFGVMKALLYAKEHQEKIVTIFYDYMGVEKHATGEWKRKTEFSEVYYKWMQRFFAENPSIKITFEKVDTHTGDVGNELADGLAKKSVGLTPNPIFYTKAGEVKMDFSAECE